MARLRRRHRPGPSDDERLDDIEERVVLLGLVLRLHGDQLRTSAHVRRFPTLRRLAAEVAGLARGEPVDVPNVCGPSAVVEADGTLRLVRRPEPTPAPAGVEDLDLHRHRRRSAPPPPDSPGAA